MKIGFVGTRFLIKYAFEPNYSGLLYNRDEIRDDRVELRRLGRESIRVHFMDLWNIFLLSI